MQRQTQETFNLPCWSVLDIVGSAAAVGTVFLDTHPGTAPVYICDVGAGTTTVGVGPFTEDKILRIVLAEGEVTSVTERRLHGWRPARHG